MRKDPDVFIRHIVESIERVEAYTKGLSRGAFLASPQAQDAVMRRLEIIGEAVKNLPKDFTEAHVDVPWQDIAGMRDVLIHEYFGVDAELVWHTVEQDLPTLKKKLTELLRGVL